MHRLLAMSFSFTLAACGGGSDSEALDATAAADAPSVDDFTPEELAILETLSPLPDVPPDPTNAFADDPGAAQLGQMLFFDKSYSGPLSIGDDAVTNGLGAVGETGKVACASCHGVGSAMLDDQRSAPNHVSLGVALGTRNAHGMVNSSFYRWTNWGGRFDSQWSLPLAVAEGGVTMKSTRLQIAHLLYAKYRAEYDAVFPVPLDPALDPGAPDAARFPASGKPKAQPTDPDGAWELMAPGDRDTVNRIFANYGKALAAYTRLLVSRRAPFDRYLAGDRGAISASAKRGLRTFLVHCVSCHGGPNLADDDFHALGVPQTGAGVPATDLGRYQDVAALLASPFTTTGAFSDDTTTGRLDGLAQNDAQKGTFRTKSLRGVAESGPYMHAGQLPSLEDVVAFYNDGGGEAADGVIKDPRIQPLGLSSEQQIELVDFLRTLTGEPVPAARLADVSK
jgi:cytochrome c peroxidase